MQKMIKTIFLSHHDGFNHIMKQNFPAVPGISFQLVNGVFNLPIGNEFCGLVRKRSDGSSSKPLTQNEVRELVGKDWHRIFRHYLPLYRNMYKWERADCVIIGLQHLNYPFIRAIRPDVPIIIYPRMFPWDWENAMVDYDDPNLIYVMHDEEMLNYDFGAKYQTFIMSSLNPDCYGPWRGDYNKVLTVFHNLDLTMFDENEPDRIKPPKTPENSYQKIVKDLPFQLYGATATPDWMGAKWIHCHEVVEEMKRFRCGLIYSRIFSAIATAQKLATGLPSVGFVAKDNEMHRIIEHGVSGFITRDIAEARGIIDNLLNDYDYAKDISEACRTAYYKRHDWNAWKEQWAQLIHSMVDANA